MERIDTNFGLTGELLQNDSAVSQILSSFSCRHLQALKCEEMISSYKLLHAFYVACIKEDSGRRKVEDCICNRCEKASSRSSKSSSELGDRKLFRIHAIHACLSCVYFGCFKDKCHIKEHLEKKKHPFAMDIDFGQVYCFECGDYKYDIDFMRIAEEQSAIAKRRIYAIKSQVKPIVGNLDKWEPSPELIDVLQYHKIMYSSETDIRSLFNIGKSTCYLNVIIQCLIHAPIFRDYLLSLQHKKKCKNVKRNLCLMCEMTNVIQESFSGKLKPFLIPKIVYGFFKRCQEFARKGFQDAHECYMDLMLVFHEDEIGAISERGCASFLDHVFYSAKTVPSNTKISPPCSCIIHEIFGFEIQKEEKCRYCKYEEVEIALNTTVSLKKLPALDVTLLECLESTWKEEDDCVRCKTSSGCTVQLKPIRLPYILNICSNQYDAKFKSTHLECEETLDLSPYILPSWKSKKDSLPEHAYYLFGAVEYDFGHYRCYIKKNKDQWYECDDGVTCPITLEEVLGINLRILFYHKMFM